MSYEFQSCLYNTSRAAHLACAGEWLSAGGNNGRQAIAETLADYSDAELATECDEGWAMSAPEAGAAAEWFDRAELQAAFAEIRRDPAAAFGWDDEE